MFESTVRKNYIKMMIRRILYISFFMLCSLVYATASPKIASTRIQILTPPAKILQLPDTFNIAIIANIYSDTRTDSLIQKNYPTDSLLAVKAAFALKAKLEDSPVFTNYDFPVYNFQRGDSKTSETALPLDVAGELAKDIRADYLFTVDIVSTDLWYDIAYMQQDGKKISYASSNVLYKFIFRFYNLHNNKIDDAKVISDTFVVETSSDVVKDAMNLFKEIIIGQEAVIKASEQAGETYATRVAPHWVDEIRYYYNDGSSNMDRASKYVNSERWSDAIEIWMKVSGSSNKQQAAMACFNMALACEMADDTALAIEWLEMAKKRNPRIETSEYEKILHKRLNR